jgi:hypothetical protein
MNKRNCLPFASICVHARYCWWGLCYSLFSICFVCFCFLCLFVFCFVWGMFYVYLDCTFLITPSVNKDIEYKLNILLFIPIHCTKYFILLPMCYFLLLNMLCHQMPYKLVRNKKTLYGEYRALSLYIISEAVFPIRISLIEVCNEQGNY